MGTYNSTGIAVCQQFAPQLGALQDWEVVS